TINGLALTYDALGRVVEQPNGSGYISWVYLPNGYKSAAYSGQSLAGVRIPLPAGGIAEYVLGNPTATISWYRHGDWLGSSRLATTPSRTKYFDSGYAPYGELYGNSGTDDRAFTGQSQNIAIGTGSTDGLYDFMFREYSPAQGRWISADPAGAAAVDLTNPQSLNRYAYVGNNPLAAVDPLGLCPPNNDNCTPHYENFDAVGSFDDSCSINGLPANCATIGWLVGAGVGAILPPGVSTSGIAVGSNGQSYPYVTTFNDEFGLAYQYQMGNGDWNTGGDPELGLAAGPLSFGDPEKPTVPGGSSVRGSVGRILPGVGYATNCDGKPHRYTFNLASDNPPSPLPPAGINPFSLQGSASLTPGVPGNRFFSLVGTVGRNLIDPTIFSFTLIGNSYATGSIDLSITGRLQNHSSLSVSSTSILECTF
ncbi:MAG TPA: RHS repeat-associated core domain-containing protein, partial [Terriglobales bacterium]|nr:RHS repeat-associated core domain-containing protein [Terriglobales bacterium]